MRQVLVTGASGQVGGALARHAWPAGLEAVALDRAALDLSDAAAIAATVASRPWAAVISAGAYTAVDRAESDVVAAWTVNALAPAAFAAACHAATIPLVHVSTDYVFDGAKPGPWTVDDPVAPVGVYGASKAGGELAVRTACPRHAIVRTSWVVSATGSNFVRTMLRLAQSHPRLRVVADQIGAPTAAADLAAALARIAVRLADDPAAPAGTFHFANAGTTSWAGFAEEIFAQTARGGATTAVDPIATADYPTPARRPANSVLDLSAIDRAYAIRPRAWQAALSDILDELIGRP